MDLFENTSMKYQDELDILLVESEKRRQAIAVFITIAAVCGTIGNCLMLHVYMNHSRGDQRKKYLTGIALAALIISLLYYPLLVLELLRPDIFLANKEVCSFTKYVKTFVIFFYLFSVLIVSVWNYIFFTYPLKGRIWIKTSRVAIVWTTAVIFSLLIATGGFLVMNSDDDSAKHFGQFKCWDLKVTGKIFAKIIIIAVLMPCLLMVAYFNGYVYRLACNVTRMRSEQSSAFAVPLKKSGKKQSCLTGMIYFLIWIPFICLLLVKAFCKCCIKPIVLLVIGDLSFFLGSFAPFFVFIMTKKYRDALLFVISCGRKGGHSFHGGSTRYDKTSSTSP